MYRSSHIDYTPATPIETNDATSPILQWEHQLKTLRFIQKKIERIVSDTNQLIQQVKSSFNTTISTSTHITSRSNHSSNEPNLSAIENNARQGQQLFYSANDIIKSLQTSKLETSQIAHITRFRSIFSDLSKELQRIQNEVFTLKQRSIIIPMDSNPTDEENLLIEEFNLTGSAISTVDTMLARGSQNVKALKDQNKRLANSSRNLNNFLALSSEIGGMLSKIRYIKKRNSLILCTVVAFFVIFYIWWVFK